MNLTDGIKLKGAPVIIPDCHRNELPGFLVAQGYKVGAEIGVFKGEFTKKFLRAGLRMYAIDPWQSFTGQGRTQHKQEIQDGLLEETKRRLAPYLGKRCRIIRKTSMDAIKSFKPNSLDFVYIDGCHEFPYVAQDIYEWNKIVRPGGIISGHDYFNTPPHAANVLCHAKAIVDAYASVYKIKNWWLFGNPNYLSWMWFKP
jgi:hypothetical protein